MADSLEAEVRLKDALQAALAERDAEIADLKNRLDKVLQLLSPQPATSLPSPVRSPARHQRLPHGVQLSPTMSPRSTGASVRPLGAKAMSLRLPTSNPPRIIPTALKQPTPVAHVSKGLRSAAVLTRASPRTTPITPAAASPSPMRLPLDRTATPKGNVPAIMLRAASASPSPRVALSSTRREGRPAAVAPRPDTDRAGTTMVSARRSLSPRKKRLTGTATMHPQYLAQALHEVTSKALRTGEDRHQRIAEHVKACEAKHAGIMQSWEQLSSIDREHEAKCALSAGHAHPEKAVASLDSIRVPPLRGLIFPPSDADLAHRHDLENTTSNQPSAHSSSEPESQRMCDFPKHSMALSHVYGCSGRVRKLRRLPRPTAESPRRYSSGQEILYVAGSVAVVVDARRYSASSVIRSGVESPTSLIRLAASTRLCAGHTELSNPLFSNTVQRLDASDAPDAESSIPTFKPQRLYQGHRKQITATASHPHLPLAATAQLGDIHSNYASEIHIWDVRSMERTNARMVLPKALGLTVNDLLFSCCGRFLVVLSTNAADSDDAKLQVTQHLSVYDITEFAEEDAEVGPISPIPTTIMSCSGVCGSDDLVYSMEAAAGSATVEYPSCQEIALHGSTTTWLASLHITMTGSDEEELRQIASTVGNQSPLYLRRLSTRKLSTHITVPIALPGTDEADRVTCGFYSPDVVFQATQHGRLVASTAGSRVVWDLGEGSGVCCLYLFPLLYDVHSRWLLACSNVNTVCLIQYHRQEHTFTLHSKLPSVVPAAFGCLNCMELLNDEFVLGDVLILAGKTDLGFVMRLEVVLAASSLHDIRCYIMEASLGASACAVAHPSLPYVISASRAGLLAVHRTEDSGLLYLGSLSTEFINKAIHSIAISSDGMLVAVGYVKTDTTPAKSKGRAPPGRDTESACDILQIQLDAPHVVRTGLVKNMIRTRENLSVTLLASVSPAHRSSIPTVLAFSPLISRPLTSPISKLAMPKTAASPTAEHDPLHYSLAAGSSSGVIDLYAVEVYSTRCSIRRKRILKPLAATHTQIKGQGKVQEPSILSLDWDCGGRVIQAALSSYELCFWDAIGGQAVRHPSVLRDINWRTYTSLFGWPVAGIWPLALSGYPVASKTLDTPTFPFNHLLSCTKNRTGNDVIVTTSTDGKLQLFAYPASRPGVPCVSYVCGSEPLLGAEFCLDDSCVVAWGMDGIGYQWVFLWSDEIAERAIHQPLDFNDVKAATSIALPISRSTTHMFVVHAQMALSPTLDPADTRSTRRTASPSPMTLAQQDEAGQRLATVAPPISSPPPSSASNCALVRSMAGAGFAKPKNAILRRRAPKRALSSSDMHTLDDSDSSECATDAAQTARPAAHGEDHFK